MLELNRKFEVINGEISEIVAKQEEEIKVKPKLYNTCIMSAFLYGLEA